MDITRCNALVASVAGGASRRHLVQMLAGSAVGGLATAVGITSADAKKKKRKKKPKTVTETCPDGTLVASVIVPATGTAVSTPILKSGQRYRLRAVGFWSTNATFGNDAFAAFKYAQPDEIGETSGGVRLGLSLNGGSPNQWGEYNRDHIYVRQVTGDGAALTLEFSDENHDDNAGSLIVDVFCA